MWIIKGAIGHFMAAFVVCLLLKSELVWSQNDTTSDSDEGKKRPIDEGMEPLYTMTNIFLDLVQPDSRGHILEKFNFTQLIEDGRF